MQDEIKRLRELAEKATNGSHFEERGETTLTIKDGSTPLVDLVVTFYTKQEKALIEEICNNLPQILAALELSEARHLTYCADTDEWDDRELSALTAYRQSREDKG